MTKLEEQFRVFLAGKPIGRLNRRENYTRFVFDEGYLQDPHRAVLGLRFEENLLAKCASNKRLPPWFSNLLPEGRLRQWIGDARGVSIDRESELLVQVGHDLPGAVTVLPEAPDEKLDLPDIDPSSPSGPTLEQNLWRFSLAGVGLKFSMLRQGERFTAPAVGEAGDWIVKLPDPGHPGVPRCEFAMMNLARQGGIETPDVKLVHREDIVKLPDRAWPHGETHAYAVKRFDRDEQRRPIHIEDLAQVRGLYPEDKYTGSFETIAALVYRRRDSEALLEFARRLAFNVIIENGDAHLKNWSLIYRDPRVPTLSPVYDLVATSYYRPQADGPEDLGLKFGVGKRFDTVKLSTFALLQAQLQGTECLVEVVRTLVKKVLDAWSTVEPMLCDEPKSLRQHIAATLKKRSQQLL